MYHVKKNGEGDGRGGGGQGCLKLWTEVNPSVDKDQVERYHKRYH